MLRHWRYLKIAIFISKLSTVKPGYNTNPWAPQKVAVVKKVVVGQRMVKNLVVILVALGIQASSC
jgi:hypothetical protein